MQAMSRLTVLALTGRFCLPRVNVDLFLATTKSSSIFGVISFNCIWLNRGSSWARRMLSCTEWWLTEWFASDQGMYWLSLKSPNSKRLSSMCCGC